MLTAICRRAAGPARRPLPQRSTNRAISAGWPPCRAGARAVHDRVVHQPAAPLPTWPARSPTGRLCQVHRLPFKGWGGGPCGPVRDGATSHDYWLSLLTPPVGKALHMGVYLAFGLVGCMSPGRRAVRCLLRPASWSARGSCWSRRCICWPDGATPPDRGTAATPQGWLVVGPPNRSRQGRAHRHGSGGERIAVFRDGARSARSATCAAPERAAGRGPHRRRLHHCPWNGYHTAWPRLRPAPVTRSSPPTAYA